MPSPTLLPGGLFLLAALMPALVGCAAGRAAPEATASATSRTNPAVDTGLLPPAAGFAPGDLAELSRLEARLWGMLDEDAVATASAAVSDGDSLPPAAAALLAAFEAAGLDAGAWRFERPAPGVNVMARLVGSDRPGEIVLLGARFDPQATGAGLRAPAAAQLAAVAHGLGKLAAGGWQPRRTIMLAAWDGSRPAPQGLRAWIEQGPLDVASSTLALLAATEAPAGGSPGIGAEPSLRPFAASVLPPPAAPAELQAGLESGLLLGLGVPVVEIATAADSGPAEVAAGARLWGILALRLADAALPPLNPAAAAQRAVLGLRAIEDQAREAFDDNPPPMRELRLALLDLRQAGERWNSAAAAALARLGRVPRGAAGATRRAPLEAAAADASRACRLPAASPAAGSRCASLLICPAPAGPAQLLPSLREAVETGDRDRLVAATLLLASAARDAAGQLLAAADMLDDITPEAP